MDRIIALAGLLLVLAAPVSASGMICDRAAHGAAKKYGVPVDVMRAITRVETGHSRDGTFMPWPWTTNIKGRGAWHDSRDAAKATIEAALARGLRSIDVGCFQINIRWHGENFESLDQMMDPEANAEYAARFLTDLHNEFGDWTRAVGAYHSRTEKYAKRYRARYRDIYAGLEPITEQAFMASAEPDQPAIPATAKRTDRQTTPSVNRFPLLQKGQGGARPPGSLMPAGSRTSPLFGEG